MLKILSLAGNMGQQPRLLVRWWAHCCPPPEPLQSRLLHRPQHPSDAAPPGLARATPPLPAHWRARSAVRVRGRSRRGLCRCSAAPPYPRACPVQPAALSGNASARRDKRARGASLRHEPGTSSGGQARRARRSRAQPASRKVHAAFHQHVEQNPSSVCREGAEASEHGAGVGAPCRRAVRQPSPKRPPKRPRCAQCAGLDRPTTCSGGKSLYGVDAGASTRQWVHVPGFRSPRSPPRL